MDLRSLAISFNERTALTTRAPQSSPVVLAYHSIGVDGGFDNISVSDFRTQIEWLDNYYDIVPLSDVVAGEKLDNRHVAVTFDDGLASFYRNALPVLAEHSVPATVFVLASVIEPHESIDLDRIVTDRLETPEKLMTRDTLDELVDDPLIEIGGHTWTHPELPEIDDPDRLEEELVESKRILESEFGVAIDQFAYPYYAWDNRTQEIIERTYSIGVRGDGLDEPIGRTTDPHLIPRISGGVEPSRLKFRVSSIGRMLLRIGKRWYC
ncbi:Peptidoglycan/xylan/chitin deacetylase, PgdA/CDA1 family [Halalkaliarchaeum sp. AArc-CO]|uniref:polysaccharide deacetylase family protein n=1 Tax=Halalkaliarchaeum sp. AArc-CO TaxID=2866381 RepID=UPI00217E47CB|nr:polysaccharide deacetylase family protein [Halalkaliarchaeum sp. AArc-CO]UWG50001.1 Peptidoglycan/xylan/chitin deacetylase, PgdA/CDA1 family [Halalkaliarchaeum sp. AArc-CO]